jgi:hypothetical protein
MRFDLINPVKILNNFFIKKSRLHSFILFHPSYAPNQLEEGLISYMMP